MKARFTHSTQHSQAIWSFHFAPAAGFSWQAGQSVRLEIPGPYGPLEHRFSIASAPSSGEVVVTTRLSGSDYKNSLAALRPGDITDLQGLTGEFVWHNPKLPHVFVAAGIGITPFYAIIAERQVRGLGTPAVLLYHSRDEPMLFSQKIGEWQALDPQFQPSLQRKRITAAQILGLPCIRDRLVYISGPSKMVGTLSADLIAAGLSPAQILQDQFTGQLSLDG